MAVPLERAIATPHPVYGLQWTADGERLAFAGGFFYGGGFVGLCDRQGRITTLRDQASLEQEEGLADAPLVLSSLCVDDSGEWLLAAACGYKWDERGPLLFRVVGGELVLHAAPELPEDADGGTGVERATGAWIHRGQLVVRYVATRTRDVLLRFPGPEGIHADAARSSLCSSRVAVVDDVAWATHNQIHRYSQAGAGAPMTAGSDLRLVLNPHGIVALDLRAPAAEATHHAVERTDRGQAIVCSRGGGALWTGLADRQIVEWELRGRTGLAPRRAWRHSAQGSRGAPVARGIQALCQLADGVTLVSADASGSVALWRDGAPVATFVLPSPWSPRCLAAHPSAPVLAIGCKGSAGFEPGAVLLYDLGLSPG
ncbi:MAG: hypothetical protein R3A79_07315 [Nannocystaceae bacterium]